MSINDYDWQKIETFDKEVKWQEMLALEVYKIVRGFAGYFGKKTSDYEIESSDGWEKTSKGEYKDDVVDCSYGYSKDDTGTYESLTIGLVPSGNRVFSILFIRKRGARDSVVPSCSINCFRVGSWLNHINHLGLKLEEIQKGEAEKSNQQQAKNLKEKFGRLD